MKNAQQERILMTRGDLGVSAPTIDFNTCSADQLERIPKLTLPVRKEIINKRLNMPNRRFASWKDLEGIKGIGPLVLESLKTWCWDPSTTPHVTQGSSRRVTQEQPWRPTLPERVSVDLDALQRDDSRGPHHVMMAWKVGSWKDEPVRQVRPRTSGLTHTTYNPPSPCVAHVYGNSYGHLPRLSPFDIRSSSTHHLGQPVPKAMLIKKPARPIVPPGAKDEPTSQYQVPQGLDQYAILWTQSKEHKAG